MDNNRRFPLILSSFWLKIIAIITMTIDHIGYMFFDAYDTTGLVLRHIGRLSFPLFCFMIVEGVIHTKSFKKYALRLGIMASIISLVIIFDEVLGFSNGGLRAEGNIFIDLLLGALAVFLLKQDKWYFKLLFIIPLGLSVASFIASCYEACGCNGHAYWYPFFLRGQYHWLGVLLIVLFFVSHYLKDIFVKVHSNMTGIAIENYQDSNLERHVLNIFSAIMIVIVSLLFYFVGESIPPQYVDWMNNIQLFAMFSGVFILLYNGKRGYNKKWFQYGSYLYYPIHMVIIYLIYLSTIIS